MNALVLPIVTPLLTAAILLLAPRRPRLQRWISFAGSLAWLLRPLSLFIRVQQEGIIVLQAGGGRRRSASLWLRISLRPCCWWRRASSASLSRVVLCRRRSAAGSFRLSWSSPGAVSWEYPAHSSLATCSTYMSGSK